MWPLQKRAPRPLWTPENLLTFVTALEKPEKFSGLEDNGFAIVVLSDYEEI